MNCKRCGRELKEGERICMLCGTPVNGERMDVSISNTSVKKKSHMPIIIFILLLLAVGVGVAIGSNQVTLGENDSYASAESDAYDTTVDTSADEEVNGESDVQQVEIIEEEPTPNAARETEEKMETEESAYDVTEGGIHRYEYYVDDCTWSEAFSKAREMGGYLVRINSRKEYEYIISEIVNQGYGEIINSPDYWAAREWMQGEPSYKDGEIEENGLDFYYYEKENRWVWNDVPDDIISVVSYYSGKIGYILEYEE